MEREHATNAVLVFLPWADTRSSELANLLNEAGAFNLGNHLENVLALQEQNIDRFSMREQFERSCRDALKQNPSPWTGQQKPLPG